MLNVASPISNGIVASNTPRSARLSASTSVACIGSLNLFQRSSFSLTKMRIPSNAMSVNSNTTLFGTGALPGRSGIPYLKNRNAPRESATA